MAINDCGDGGSHKQMTEICEKKERNTKEISF